MSEQELIRCNKVPDVDYVVDRDETINHMIGECSKIEQKAL